MPNRPITLKEKKTWNFAKEAHKSQIRKFINQPYFDAHVQKVNGIVKRYTRDEDILCAALLHDVCEDCYEDAEVGYTIIKDKFGERVADLVWEVTSKGDEIDHDYDGSKTNYLLDKMINMSEDALIIKLADRLQNISDAFTATERFRNKYFEETTTIIRELENNRSFNRIHLQLIGDIKSKLDNISTIFKIKRFGEI
jgi:(p)ppGpp synthase/HD superfamily hydrolase